MDLEFRKAHKSGKRVFIALLVNYYRVNECEHERIYSEDLM
jgi:hypothetical protein